MTQGSVLSVVDYASWEKGYMPPSEHVLIDQLSYRGAKVLLAADHGEHGAFWLVIRGKRPTRDRIRKIMEMLMDDFMEEVAKPPQRFTIVNDGPDRFVLADAESDEPAPVYPTIAEAEAALALRLAE